MFKILARTGEKLGITTSGSLSLDCQLGVGGLPTNRVVEIYGPESSGKTTLALHAIAEAQKLGGSCVIVLCVSGVYPGAAPIHPTNTPDPQFLLKMQQKQHPAHLWIVLGCVVCLGFGFFIICNFSITNVFR